MSNLIAELIEVIEELAERRERMEMGAETGIEELERQAGDLKDNGRSALCENLSMEIIIWRGRLGRVFGDVGVQRGRLCKLLQEVQSILNRIWVLSCI